MSVGGEDLEGSAKWQAAGWPWPRSTSSGATWAQISWALKQRVRNRQPLGGSVGLGAPRSRRRSAARLEALRPRLGGEHHLAAPLLDRGRRAPGPPAAGAACRQGQRHHGHDGEPAAQGQDRFASRRHHPSVAEYLADPAPAAQRRSGGGSGGRNPGASQGRPSPRRVLGCRRASHAEMKTSSAGVRSGGRSGKASS